MFGLLTYWVMRGVGRVSVGCDVQGENFCSVFPSILSSPALRLFWVNRDMAPSRLGDEWAMVERTLVCLVLAAELFLLGRC
jgi:hypothetical protein